MPPLPKVTLPLVLAAPCGARTAAVVVMLLVRLPLSASLPALITVAPL